MNNSYTYLNSIANNNTGYLGNIYRFTLKICSLLMFREKSKCVNFHMLIVSMLYSMSLVVVLLIYHLSDDPTLDEYIDDIEFQLLLTGMIVSNIMLYFIRYDIYHCFIYYTLLKLLGYLSQFYLVYVYDITIDIVFSLDNVLSKVFDVNNQIVDYVYLNDSKTNEFWLYVFIVAVILAMITFLFTGNPHSYLIILTSLLIMNIGICVVNLIILIVPIAYILCLIVCMYLWGLIFLVDFIGFIKEIYYISFDNNYQNQQNEINL